MKTKQIMRTLLLPVLFLACLVACGKDDPFKEKPRSMENTVWARLIASDMGRIYVYYFKPEAKYTLRDEYYETVPEIVKDPVTGKPIVVVDWVQVTDPEKGETTREPFERDSVRYVSQAKADTLDYGTYKYEFEQGAFDMLSGKYKDDQGKSAKLSGHFADGFIYVDGSGSFLRMK